LSEEKIAFHTEDVDFELVNQHPLSNWIENIIKNEGKELGFLNYVFCSDEYLHQLNMEYLEHDTLTDIITFPYSYAPIESDIFISIERVEDNAKDLKIPFERELYRVIIHGVLHLCGYGDETDEEETAMRAKEDMCLAQLPAF
jgi:rRNA maturation RNase YbeY